MWRGSKVFEAISRIDSTPLTDNFERPGDESRNLFQESEDYWATIESVSKTSFFRRTKPRYHRCLRCNQETFTDLEPVRGSCATFKSRDEKKRLLSLPEFSSWHGIAAVCRCALCSRILEPSEGFVSFGKPLFVGVQLACEYTAATFYGTGRWGWV